MQIDHARTLPQLACALQLISVGGDRVRQPTEPEAMTAKQLMSELLSDASLLVQRHVALARLEARAELERGRRSFAWLGVAAALGYAGLLLIIVAGALALGALLSHAYWAGALVVAAALLLLAAIGLAIGWRRRVRRPLGRSREELKKEISWAKDQLTT
jgi:hypothetical protein